MPGNRMKIIYYSFDGSLHEFSKRIQTRFREESFCSPHTQLRISLLKSVFSALSPWDPLYVSYIFYSVLVGNRTRTSNRIRIISGARSTSFHPCPSIQTSTWFSSKILGDGRICNLLNQGYESVDRGYSFFVIGYTPSGTFLY